MKICKYCQKEITKLYNIFCDRKCTTAYRKTFPRKIDKVVHLINCKNCGNSTKVKQKGFIFCCKSCAVSFNNLHRARRSDESRERASIKSKEFAKNNPELIKLRNQKVKQYWQKYKKSSRHTCVCKNCKNEFNATYVKTYCSKTCMKLGFRENGLNALGTGSGKSGRYRGMKCQSTYELAFVIWAIDEGKSIKRCGLKIEYEFENRKRLFNPDFEIDGIVYEIKGYLNEIAKVKLQAAKDKNIDITLIGREEAQFYIGYVNQKYNCNIEKDYAKFYEEKKTQNTKEP